MKRWLVFSLLLGLVATLLGGTVRHRGTFLLCHSDYMRYS
jgi:hypothetical protein